MANATRKIMGAGNSPLSTTAIVGDTQTSLTATGTNQATALLLNADDNEVTTTASGTGVILNSNNTLGDSCFVANSGANALLVYAEVGSTINALGTTTGFSVAAGGRALFIKVTATKYFAILSA